MEHLKLLTLVSFHVCLFEVWKQENGPFVLFWFVFLKKKNKIFCHLGSVFIVWL